MSLCFSSVRYQLNVKVVSKDDTVKEKLTNYYKSLLNHHEGDSGIDLYSLQSSNMSNNHNNDTIDFQIQCEMIDLKYNTLVSYTLIPRSSISKTPFMMRNSIGLIDAGYRGNIMAKIIYIEVRDTQGASPFVGESRKEPPIYSAFLPEGRWFQLVAPNNGNIKVNVLSDYESLTTTSRGEGGFGSTT